REFLKARKNRKEKSDPSLSIPENKTQKWALIFGFGSRTLKSLSYTGTSGDLSIFAEYLAPKTNLGFLFGVGYQNYKITGSNQTSFAEPLTLDLGMSWHFFPESDLDLYLAGKIGFGTLGDSGAFWKASISPGLRFFLNKTEKDRGEFLFLEGILEKPYFSSQNSPFQEDFYAYGLRIGIGTWL
ncbi:MAG TPA: hypothetical protein PK453_07905, partial [Leptospiraceae bacterium]|nr:hypothetical protein [Leptospiraceae bacterium]